MSLKKVIDAVKRKHNFLITSHTSLEGDALGSELAFYRLLKSMGKRAIVVNEDNAPCGYEFLPEVNKIKKVSRLFPTMSGSRYIGRRDPATAGKATLRKTKFDCFVALDCSDLKRCGEVSKINLKHKTILNIDHHTSNEGFGDINWVEPDASSTCEMIYKLYKKLRIPLDKDIAMLLYVGILTDTGSFHYANTTSLTHKIAAQLLRFNLNIPQIYKNIYENIPFSDMQLLSSILPTIRRQVQGKVAWLQIKKGLLKNKKISFDLAENILTFARAIKDVEVAVLFKENLGKADEIRVNLRSQGKIDVNKIAHFFGGGGHKTASGCTVKGKLDEVRKAVLGKIKSSFE